MSTIARRVFVCVAVYWERVDWWGHEEGPAGPSVLERVREVDAILVDLLDRLDQEPIINLVMFSDHGMVKRVAGAPLINVLQYTDWGNIYKSYGSKSGPVLQIWPAEGKLDTVRPLGHVIIPIMHQHHP